MSTKSAVSLEEYLRTSFDNPDREYVDGEIVERPLPDLFHSKTHFRLAWLIGNLAQTRPFFGQVELRSRVGQTRVRIPDVSIYAGEEPTELVPTKPPFVAIEILSPDDRYSELMQKFKEYKTWGVRHVWLVDPQGRDLHIYADGVLKEVAVLEIPEYDAQITSAEIFG
jgi:Uma2 family endonuclease